MLFDANFDFSFHDEARSFFLNLQNEMKNINFLPFGSERYLSAKKGVKEKIEMQMKGAAV